MSGHSHWAGIKHKKALTDAKRAKIFTKHGKIITIAAREDGGDPDTNFKLRLAIDRARFENMPKDNIDRAIKRGTGEVKEGAEIEEVIYEAYGPGNVAMLIKTATDSKNRTLGEIKTILTKNGGKGVPAGSVSFLFKLMGGISVSSKENEDQYEMEMKAIEAGAEDTSYADSILTLYIKPEDLQRVKENLESRGLKTESADLVYVPLQKISISEEEKNSYEKLLELLDDQDDVQEIYDNL